MGVFAFVSVVDGKSLGVLVQSLVGENFAMGHYFLNS